MFISWPFKLIIVWLWVSHLLFLNPGFPFSIVIGIIVLISEGTLRSKWYDAHKTVGMVSYSKSRFSKVNYFTIICKEQWHYKGGGHCLSWMEGSERVLGKGNIANHWQNGGHSPESLGAMLGMAC